MNQIISYYFFYRSERVILLLGCGYFCFNCFFFFCYFSPPLIPRYLIEDEKDAKKIKKASAVEWADPIDFSELINYGATVEEELYTFASDMSGEDIIIYLSLH